MHHAEKYSGEMLYAQLASRVRYLPGCVGVLPTKTKTPGHTRPVGKKRGGETPVPLFNITSRSPDARLKCSVYCVQRNCVHCSLLKVFCRIERSC